MKDSLIEVDHAGSVYYFRLSSIECLRRDKVVAPQCEIVLKSGHSIYKVPEKVGHAVGKLWQEYVNGLGEQ